MTQLTSSAPAGPRPGEPCIDHPGITASTRYRPGDRSFSDGQSAIDRRIALINFGAIVVPLIGLGAAIALLWGTAFNAWYLLLMVGRALVSALGVTVGFHRLCTHRSFATPAWLRYCFAAAGSMAVQGSVIYWCSEHRKHHQHSDTEHDPHSPHMSRDGSWGDGVWATLRGAYHAHVGWLMEGSSNDLEKYGVDLRADRAIALADKQFVMWVIIGLVFPAVLAGVITLSWWGVLLGFLWGGLVRVLLVHHVTWSVNSICHLWGTQPFDSHDESRNNAVIAFLALGEGWHNNHHAFPASARHGLRWWEFDLSYLVIRGLALVGLATKIRLPNAERVAARRH
ncbi:MAG: fatty acid desaturase [Planctomycetota bacterium]